MTGLSGWLAVCGLKREAQIWGGPAVVGGGRADRLADALQAMIEKVRPEGLVSFGLAGALSPALQVGNLVVGGSVLSEGRTWTCDPEVAGALASSFSVTPLRVLGSDRAIADPAEKSALWTTADAVDMESQVAAEVAERAGLPFAVLRVVSDGAGHVLPPAAVAGFRDDGGIDVSAVLAALARDPGQLPALMAMGRNSGLAFRRLKAVRAQLVRPAAAVRPATTEGEG